MKEQIQEYAKKLLVDGKIGGFLGLRQEGDHICPHLFTKPEELDDLSLGDMKKAGEARYPLVKILTRLAMEHPTDTLGIMVRGCEERAIARLIAASQLSKNRIILAGFPCPEELAEAHGCLKPYPEALVAGSKPEGPVSQKVITATPRNLIRDMQFIQDVSNRCIKCYGCRNICPVCFCKECTLEEETFVPKGSGIPPANPDFLLTRAIHMVGYCVYCGLCEEACPADIPLTTLYKMVANIMNEQHGYKIQGGPPRGEGSGETERQQAAV